LLSTLLSPIDRLATRRMHQPIHRQQPFPEAGMPSKSVGYHDAGRGE
jgi:hypothetical protein